MELYLSLQSFLIGGGLIFWSVEFSVPGPHFQTILVQTGELTYLNELSDLNVVF